MNLKILSYNIHKGFDWANNTYNLVEMKRLIQGADADLILLQEVSGQNDEHKKKGLVDSQFEFLADSLWTHFAYARNAVYDHGHHGNLVLSKYPIASWDNTNLTTNPFEQRGLLLCRLEIPQLQNKTVYAGCLHLDLLQRGRNKQYRMISQKIQTLNLDEKTPLIIGGDFNDWNRGAGEVFEKQMNMREAFREKHGAFARTFPAGFPLLNLDRIYLKNCSARSAQIWKSQSDRHFSDHLPLLCEVDIGS